VSGLLHPVGPESVQTYWAQRALVSGSSGSGGCHSRWPFPNPASQTPTGLISSSLMGSTLGANQFSSRNKEEIIRAREEMTGEQPEL
jgi:hypothetical protein